MKKFFSLCLSVTLIICLASGQVSASEDANSNPEGLSFTEEVIVTEENIQNIIADYGVPKEVADSLTYRINTGDKENLVTLLVPVERNEASAANPRSTTSSWSPIRIYDGYQLTDWVITIRNSHEPTAVVSNATENNCWHFVGSLLAFCGGSLLEELPLYGVLTSAAEFFSVCKRM